MPMLLSMSDLGDATSGAICLLVTDIGELRQVQQSLQESRDELEIKIEKRTRELRESEERYRELVQSAPDAVIVHRDREFLYANPVALRLFGAESLEELRSRAVLDLIHADDRAAIAMSMEQRQAGQRLPLQETRLVRLDGRVVPVESVGGVIKYDGKLAMQTIIRDITERRQMEKALQKAHDGLEQQVEERTVELRTALSEIITLKEQLEAENIYFRHENKMKRQFEHIIGQSDGLKYVLYRAEQVAPLNTTVLILGETGTGKELIAFAIHDMSPRKERPLITVNCAALPGNLIESELFGREKGAFTGADTRQVGRFEVAHDSTLCLDEIGELPLEVQAKLLRVIQHNEFERLGSSHTVKVDVRIIATTNRDLEEEVRKGRFRQDLYYRLNVFPITVPPLRQRKEDIPLMVQAFMERYSRKLGKQITSIRNETMKELQDYPWPGNVRELESIIERAVILCPGPVLQLADKLEISSSPLLSAVRTLEETERNQILKILSETRLAHRGKGRGRGDPGPSPEYFKSKDV